MTDFQYIDVKATEHLGGHTLRITFSDGHISTVDFAPFVFGDHSPDITDYQNEKLFLEYEIKSDNLNWHDYKMIFPVEDLYQNTL